MKAFLNRPIEGDWPHLWIDATYIKVRQNGRIVSVAVIKLVISDAHEGIKGAVSKVMYATWQRCRVHFMRNVSAHAGKSARRVVTA